MNSNETNSEIGFEQNLSGIVMRNVIPTAAIPRRTFLAVGTAVGASVLLGRMAGAASLAGVAAPRSRSPTSLRMASPCMSLSKGTGLPFFSVTAFRILRIPGVDK